MAEKKYKFILLPGGVFYPIIYVWQMKKCSYHFIKRQLLLTMEMWRTIQEIENEAQKLGNSCCWWECQLPNCSFRKNCK